MEKYLNATEILLPRGNKAKCPIYEHEGYYYIKANKPNTASYTPFIYNGTEYSQVIYVNGYWFKK